MMLTAGYVYVYTVKVFKNKQRSAGKKNEKIFLPTLYNEKITEEKLCDFFV